MYSTQHVDRWMDNGMDGTYVTRDVMSCVTIRDSLLRIVTVAW